MSLDQFLLSADTTDFNYPEIRPTLDLNFARTKTLDPRITFARSSGGSYVGPDGLIKYAGVNEARFDHDPTTGESLGLLIEEGRINSLTYSEDFSNAAWTPNQSPIITTNASTSPDGTTNATRFATELQDSGVFRFPSLTSGIAYTYSLFVKAVSGSNIIYFGTDAGTAATVNVNTLTGVASSRSGSPTNITSISYPNGWYRISFTFTASVTALHSFVMYNPSAIPNTWLVWGAQVEQGAFPTSYIPTVASTRTRALDSASITGRNFSSFYRQDEGTFISSARYDGTPIPGVLNRVLFSVADSNNGVIYYNHWWEQTNTAALVVEYPPGANSFIALLFSGPTLSIGDRRKTASVYKKNDFALTANGISPSLDTSGEIKSTHANLYIGNLAGVTWFFCGRIARLTYYPQRLPNAQLQALTR